MWIKLCECTIVNDHQSRSTIITLSDGNRLKRLGSVRVSSCVLVVGALLTPHFEVCLAAMGR